MSNISEFSSSANSFSRSRTTANVDRANLRRLLMGLVAVLLCVGVQMVHSASLTSRPSERESTFLVRHLAYLVVSLLCGAVASRISSGWLRKNAVRFFWLLVLLLALLLVPGIGSRINGAQRWFRFGGLSFQPSELGRIILPMLAASMVCQMRDRDGFSISKLPATLMPLVVTLPLVAVEPDLGATVFLGLGFLLTLFIGGWPLRYFFTTAMMAVPAAASLLILRPYQL
ncbi:MAG: FtsW/RodA/SpoVE family cell cycle protein, partial [Planctomycetota bacterium]